MQKIFEMIEVPVDLDYEMLLNSFLGRQFIMHHDLSSSKTYVVADSDWPEIARNAIAGLTTVAASGSFKLNNPLLAVVYVPSASPSAKAQESGQLLGALYNLFSGTDAQVSIAFAPGNLEDARRIKGRVEELLSRIATRATKSYSNKATISSSTSLQSDIYYNSDDKVLFSNMLDNLNSIIAMNGTSYKALIVLSGEYEQILSYIKSKLLVMEMHKINVSSLEELADIACSIEAMPLNHSILSRLFVFSERILRIARSNVQVPRQSGNIDLGVFLDRAVSPSGTHVMLDASTLNLGTIVTGMPGTGKTTLVMSMLSQLNALAEKPVMAIISPTHEWSAFANANGLNFFQLYESKLPVNFFTCYDAASKEKYYENLAMLLANASVAGPYKNSLEKSLLAAFRKVYSLTLNPDPVEMYYTIEETVIEQHATKTNVGVKYTKHGENIRAALENLRLLLFRPEFATKDGINMMSFLKGGAVFDLSKVSNSMKQFYYSLILNIVYAFSENFDENADNERKLKLVIVLDEAQEVINADETSAVVLDLKQRIQDFRKKGIGIVLITHNPIDISGSIRRVCQTKIYFRQSADMVKYSATDLGFIEQDSSTMSLLRGLGERTFVLDYVRRDDVTGYASPAGPIFVRSKEYALPAGEAQPTSLNCNLHGDVCDCKIYIRDREKAPLALAEVKLFYLGELVSESKTDEAGKVVFNGLLRGKKYSLQLPAKKKKDTRIFQFSAQDNIDITADVPKQ